MKSMIDKIAITDTNSKNEYELPIDLYPPIIMAEVYNSKTKKYREADYYVCLKIVKPKKSDTKIKIYYY